jgi:ABC-type glucose/galactose transport system permease subunit
MGQVLVQSGILLMALKWCQLTGWLIFHFAKAAISFSVKGGGSLVGGVETIEELVVEVLVEIVLGVAVLGGEEGGETHFR